jgi:hypothetical protein
MFVTSDLHTLLYIQGVHLFYSSATSNATRLSPSGSVSIDITPKLNKNLAQTSYRYFKFFKEIPLTKVAT